tara:strand:- start:3481 stop:4335 length:855 start_codon:yes stop_codon:yes gene_type:complete
MNDITKINGSELAELAEILGTEVTKSGGNSAILRVPELKINAKSRNKITKKAIPEGSFYLTGSDAPVYAETVSFRPLASHVQYFHWDEVDGKRKLVNKSLAVKNPYKDEARDTLGGIACGMPSWDARKEMEYDEAKKWRAMQHRVIRGVVSYTGKTEDGEEVTVENKPCIMFHKNSNYSGFYNEFIKKLPDGSQIYNYAADLTSSYNENGSVVWYTFNYYTDLKNELGMTKDIHDTMLVFADALRAENKYVDERYFKAIKEGSIDSAAIDALGDSLDADFEEVA